MVFYILAGIIFLLILVYRKIIKPAKYWQERDVVHVKAWPVIGSVKDFVTKKKHLIDVISDIYKQYPNERCVGYMNFTTPFLMIRDLELIKRIGVKDFDYFHDHLAFDNLKADPLLSKSLVSLRGENWKRMRATLSHVFASNKMQIMYSLMVECAEKFTKHFEEKERHEVEMKEIFSKFANDVIATTAFGIKVDSFSDLDNNFIKMGTKFTDYDRMAIVKVIFMEFAPRLANLLQIRIFTDDVSTFFRALVKDNIHKRESEGIIRPDFIHLLMEARKGELKEENIEKEKSESLAMAGKSQNGKNSSHMELTNDQIVAQALLFFMAGFDTVSTGSSFMAHELALHPHVQKKLQNEIDAVIKEYKGKVPYEALISMKYLDQVICETLRLWPPGFQTERLCVKDYVIEPKHPKEKVVFVQKGTSVMFPIMAIHRDTQYYNEPNKFDPERFSDENKANILPGTYLPFGVGPRNCIGSRFALLEIKILFFHLLSKFIIVPLEETEVPLRLGTKKIKMEPENGFRLGLRRRVLKGF